jgi:serine/threonine protein kinase
VCGLRAVHASDVLYCDLKTDNLLLDTAGNVKLADFGLSVRLTPGNKWLATEQTGTEGYQAREMLMGRKAYSFSSDLYSLGVVAYMLLVGRLPFPHLVDVIADTPPAFVENSTVSEAAQDFMTRLLSSLGAGRLGDGVGKAGGDGRRVDWAEVCAHPFLAHHGVTEGGGRCTSLPSNYRHAEVCGEPLYGVGLDILDKTAVLPSLNKQEQAQFANFDFTKRSREIK